MELFDLEIPIRSTGLDATRQDFRALEQAGTDSAKRVETALARTAPPASVAQGFTRTAASAIQATAALEGMGRAATSTASADASLAAQQAQAATGFRNIARDILQAKAASDAGTLSADELGVALATARQQAIALKGGLALPTAQAEAFRVIMHATVPAIAAADGAMKLIATDLKQAEAAYRAGTISLKDYAVAQQTARAQAIAASQGTQLAGSELTAFSTILRQTEQTTGRARQGLGTMRSSMLSLAATMVGTRSTAGTLAGALLQFSIGNPLAVGVSAGLLAVVVLYERLTKATRDAKAATDKLIESLRKERDERIAAEHPELPFQATTAQIRERQAQLQRDLETALKGEAVSGGTGGRGTTIVNQQRVSELRRQISELDTLQLEALRRENEAQTALTDARRADLVTLVQAGTAKKAEEAELQRELARTKTELAGMSDATRATVEGRARAASLTERITTIEGAFATQAKASTKEVAAGAKSLRERIDALIALQTLETPTAARWQELLDRAIALRNELDKGNLTLLQRRDALEELQRIQEAVDFGTPQIERVQSRGPDLRRLPPLTLDQPVAIPGGADSLFGRMVAQIEAGGKSAEDAIDSVHDKLAAKAQELAGVFEGALVAGLVGIAAGGSIGQAIAGIAGEMLAALGTMAIQFGLEAIGIAALMEKILTALATLNPIVAIAAGAALVALGTMLKGAASKSFGGAPGRSGGGASLQPINQTFTISSGSRTAPVAQTETRASALRTTPVTLTVNHFGGRDPAFGRWLGDQLSAAQARGAA